MKPWSDAWDEFVPFLSFDVEIRKVICSTNAIESVNARIRRAVRARGHFPDEAALKCIYMALMSRDPTGKRIARQMHGRAGFILLRHRVLLGQRHAPSPPNARQGPAPTGPEDVSGDRVRAEPQLSAPVCCNCRHGIVPVRWQPTAPYDGIRPSGGGARRGTTPAARAPW